MKQIMGIGKYKYYFKKPKSAIVKDCFLWLCVGGAVAIAATSPYFVQNLLSARKRFERYPKRRVSSTFDRLRRDGFILIQKKKNCPRSSARQIEGVGISSFPKEYLDLSI